MEAPDRNIGLDLVRVTEAAALSCSRWLGKGDKIAGDQAAVDAMRLSFNTVPLDGIIVIGEGEKDEAPMLFNGEKVGMGLGQAVDVAVDPVEGTNLLAYGRPNAISVIGVAPRGSMFDPGPSYYMKKLVVPAEAKDAADLDAPVGDNLRAIARALGKDVDDLVVFVRDQPRHKELITAIRKAGARPHFPPARRGAGGKHSPPPVPYTPLPRPPPSGAVVQTPFRSGTSPAAKPGAANNSRHSTDAHAMNPFMSVSFPVAMFPAPSGPHPSPGARTEGRAAWPPGGTWIPLPCTMTVFPGLGKDGRTPAGGASDGRAPECLRAGMRPRPETAKTEARTSVPDEIAPGQTLFKSVRRWYA